MWAPFVAVAVIGMYLTGSIERFDSETLFALVGGIFAVAFFLRKSHTEDAQFLYQLFTQFNERYDSLNDDLGRIADLAKSDVVPPKDRAAVIDYFNLCSEEYFLYEEGFVTKRVWRAWSAGMKQWYAKSAVIQRIWGEESVDTDAYYGFDFLKLWTLAAYCDYSIPPSTGSVAPVM